MKLKPPVAPQRVPKELTLETSGKQEPHCKLNGSPCQDRLAPSDPRRNSPEGIRPESPESKTPPHHNNFRIRRTQAIGKAELEFLGKSQ